MALAMYQVTDGATGKIIEPRTKAQELCASVYKALTGDDLRLSDDAEVMLQEVLKKKLHADIIKLNTQTTVNQTYIFAPYECVKTDGIIIPQMNEREYSGEKHLALEVTVRYARYVAVLDVEKMEITVYVNTPSVTEALGCMMHDCILLGEHKTQLQWSIGKDIPEGKGNPLKLEAVDIVKGDI